jgi:hypothetical protein
MAATGSEARMRTVDDARLEEGWLVCLGEARAVRDGRVRCAIQGRRVPVEACLLCRHLETLAGERDDTSCAVAGGVTPLQRPR